MICWTGLEPWEFEFPFRKGSLTAMVGWLFFFCFTLVTGPKRSLSRKLSDARVYEPQIRARLGRVQRVARVERSVRGELHREDGHHRRNVSFPMLLLLSLLLSSLELSDSQSP